MKVSELSQGVIVPLVTPSNIAELLSLIDYVIQGGITQLVVTGTTGEAPRLSQKQKLNIIAMAAQHIGKRAKLLVGISTPVLGDAIELMAAASEVGAVASLVMPLMLGNNGATTIEALLTAASGALMLYNNPSLTAGASLSLDQIQPFFSEPRVFGIKDTSGEFTYLDALLNQRGSNRFKVFYGREQKFLEAVQRPIDGFVPSSANVGPALATQIWEKKALGPWDEWNALKETIKNKSPQHIQALKLLLQERGLITDASLL